MTIASRKPPKQALVTVPGALDASLSPRKSVARRAAAELSSNVKRGGKHGRSFADLLSRLYTIADDLVTELESAGDATAIAKRSEALKSVAKTLPLLQQAERNARTAVKRKALDDMTDAEVEQAARAMLDFPIGGGFGAVVPNPALEDKNRFLEKNNEIEDLEPEVDDD